MEGLCPSAVTSDMLETGELSAAWMYAPTRVAAHEFGGSIFSRGIVVNC